MASSQSVMGSPESEPPKKKYGAKRCVLSPTVKAAKKIDNELVNSELDSKMYMMYVMYIWYKMYTM